MKNRTKNWSLCKSTFHLREREREREMSRFKPSASGLCNAKIANYCSYVRGVWVCVRVCLLRCVCAMSANVKGDGDHHWWRHQRFEFHEKKLNYNLSLGVFIYYGFVWAFCQWKFFSCWLVCFFRNSVRFSMGYSKDLCVLKESVWKWKWFAINKLKYEWDDNSNSRIITIINNGYKKGNFH